MATTRRIKKKPTAPKLSPSEIQAALLLQKDDEDLESKVVEEVTTWQNLRKQAKTFNDSADQIKVRFKGFVDRNGKIEDEEKLHKVYRLPKPVGRIVAIIQQRSVSSNLNETVAREILTKKGLLQNCVETIEVLSIDKIYAATYRTKDEDGKVLPMNKRLTRYDIDQMFQESESYSFIAMDKDGKAVGAGG